MTSLIFEFPDIRSRMLGDDKPAPKKKAEDALNAFSDALRLRSPQGETLSATAINQSWQAAKAKLMDRFSGKTVDINGDAATNPIKVRP
jgi:hypothetical protein